MHAKSKGFSLIVRPTSSAYAMDVGINRIGHVKIYDVSYFCYINSSGG
jgi:hypothetical protein